MIAIGSAGLAPAPGTHTGHGRPILMLRALRAYSFPLSVLPVFVVTAAVSRPSGWHWGVLLVSAAGVVLLHAAGNLLNDYFDFRSGVDRKVDGDEGRPGRLLVRGELSPRDVLFEALACLLLAVPAAAYLLWQCGPALLWFGGAAVLMLYAYTGAPFRLKYRALGEPVIFAVFGPLLLVGAAYAQTGRWEWGALFLSVPVGLATTAVVLGNNIRDVEEDGEGCVRTLVHRMGGRAARLIYALLVLAPPAMVAALVAAGVLRFGALAALVAYVPAALVLRRALGNQRLPDIDARTAQYVTVFLATLWLGMTLA